MAKDTIHYIQPPTEDNPKPKNHCPAKIWANSEKGKAIIKAQGWVLAKDYKAPKKES